MLILFPFFLILLSVISFKWCPEGNIDYVSRGQTDSIKGLFVLLVSLGHIYGCLSANDVFPGGLANKLAQIPHSLLGQFVVVMFLFYSGYGVFENIKKDSVNQGTLGSYVRNMPRHRILSTFINFQIAIVFYIILSPLTKAEFSWKDLPLYFSGWATIGNPSWYIVVILLCYIVTWLIASNKLLSLKPKGIVISFLMIALAVFLWVVKGAESWWYDTVLAYGAGVLFSLYKESFDTITSSNKDYWIITITTSLSFIGCYLLRDIIPHIIIYNVLSVLFAFTIVLLSKKIVFFNPFLNLCGTKLFFIYMYFPLVFQCLINIGADSHTFAFKMPFLFVLTSFVITLVISKFYHFWQVKL